MAETDISVGSSHAGKPWQFKPGQSGNPSGKPAGTTEQAATKKLLAQVTGVGASVLAEVLADPETRAKLTAGTTALAQTDPAWFWRYVMVPLLPKNIVLEGDGLDAVRSMYIEAVAMASGRKPAMQTGEAGSGESKSEAPSL